MNIDQAVELARERRATTGQHYAVMQSIDRYRVVVLRTNEDFRPAWTTRDDVRLATRKRYRKLLREDIPLIEALAVDGVTVNELARKFEVARTTVKRLLKNR